MQHHGSQVGSIEQPLSVVAGDFQSVTFQTVVGWCRCARSVRLVVESDDTVGRAEIARDRILSDDEIRSLWRALDSCRPEAFVRIVRALLLSAARLRGTRGLIDQRNVAPRLGFISRFHANRLQGEVRS